MFEVHITIHLKEGISDPEGANTLKTIHLLGYESVQDAKTSKIITLHMDGKDKTAVRKDVEGICQRLLINPVIHRYSIKIQSQKSEE